MTINHRWNDYIRRANEREIARMELHQVRLIQSRAPKPSNHWLRLSESEIKFFAWLFWLMPLVMCLIYMAQAS